MITIADNAAPGLYTIDGFTSEFQRSEVADNTVPVAISEDLTITPFRVTVTPEPGTMSLLVLGGLGVMARRRRNR